MAGEPGATVVEAIADHTGTTPEALTTPLEDVTDPDALDQLFHDRDTDGQVQFVYEDLSVTVTSDGRVTVISQSERSETGPLSSNQSII